MAWTNLTFPAGSKLTSSKMTQVNSNFAALAAGEAGAPPLSVNSLMWSGVASGGLLNVSSGFQTTGVGSFGALDVSSGIRTTEAASFGAVSANSGFQTTEVGSFGSINVSSGFNFTETTSFDFMTVSSGFQMTEVGSFGGLDVNSGAHFGSDPGGSPAANTLYKSSVPKAWINFNGTGTIAIRDSFNVSSITDNGTGNYTVTFDTDFADTNYSWSTVCEQEVSTHYIQVLSGASSANSYHSKAAGAMQLHATTAAGGGLDMFDCNVHFFGDQ